MNTDIDNTANHVDNPDDKGEELIVLIDLVVAAMSTVELPEDCDAPQAVLSAASFVTPLHKALRLAFEQGGLDQVDVTVEEINAGLRKTGSQVELGDGAALSHDALGEPEDLMVTFRRPGTDRPIACEWISL